MAIIAVTGRKGGVGKSTVAGNLAGEFGAMGRSVLVLDADPQHSIVSWAEQGEGLLSRSVRKISPAENLRARAKQADKEADVVLIDTPPGQADVAYQAALAADLVLLPCGPSPLDLFALKQALAVALKARAERRSKRPRVRFVPSKVIASTLLGRNLASSLREMGKKVLPAISQRVVVPLAVTYGLTVAEYAPDSPSHEEFRALAKAVDEILER
jgi:chromosome partitioning protein